MDSEKRNTHTKIQKYTLLFNHFHSLLHSVTDNLICFAATRCELGRSDGNVFYREIYIKKEQI